MAETINIYCDESCHLEHDHLPFMVLGAIWCPLEQAREIAVRIREIKGRYGMGVGFEAKWVKASPAKKQLYVDLVDYFFDDSNLHFRALVANKANLRHEAFGQDHDTWYYKMYFDMLKTLLRPQGSYRIYIDIKDTHTGLKLRKLHEVLCNNMYDFQRRILERVEAVRSHEVEQIQLADVLVGAIAYANRNLQSNAAKSAVVERMRQRSGYSLTRTTLLREEKINLFHWSAQEVQG